MDPRLIERFAFVPGVVQRSRQRDVINIVPRCVRQGSGLTPTRLACVNQLLVTRETLIRTKTQPLHDPGTKALYQHIGAFTQSQYCIDTLCLFQIQYDRLLATLVEH